MSLVVFASPPTRADDGLLGDTGPVVEAPVGQVVEAVVQGVEPAVQPAVEPAVAPVVEVAEQAAEPVREATQPVMQAAEPVKQAAEPVKQAVEPVRQAAGPAVEPVVQSAPPAVGQAAEPSVQPVEPASGTSPLPATPPVGSADVPNDNAAAASSAAPPERVAPRGAGRQDPSRGAATAHRSFPDLAPRTAGAPRFLAYPSTSTSDEQDPEVSRHDLVAVTDALMNLYAGHGVPGGIDAGLLGAVSSARTRLWTAPLLLGLLLGLWSLVLWRRGREGWPDGLHVMR